MSQRYVEHFLFTGWLTGAFDKGENDNSELCKQVVLISFLYIREFSIKHRI